MRVIKNMIRRILSASLLNFGPMARCRKLTEKLMKPLQQFSFLLLLSFAVGGTRTSPSTAKHVIQPLVISILGTRLYVPQRFRH